MMAAAVPLAGDGFFAGIKGVNAMSSYSVRDDAQGLEARLRFPAAAAVGVLGYAYETEAGALRLAFASAFASEKRTGDDTDRKDGNRTVSSESETTLEGYWAFGAEYRHRITSHFALGAGLFYEEWRLDWSHTREVDYTSGTRTDISGKTVRFTRQSGGLSLYGAYEATLFTFPWRFRGGILLARQYTKDEHLERGFYTLSEGWMKGVSVGADVLLFRYGGATVEAGVSYRRSEGDADMRYYYDYGPHYKTLPAVFTSEITEAMLTYRYPF